MFNFVEKRRWYFLIAGVLVVLSAAALIVSTVQIGTPLQWTAETKAVEAAGLALLAAAVITPLFTWWSFRDAQGAFRYGVCALAVLAHSLIVACGFYALMGILAGWEADNLFFVAILIVTSFAIRDAVTLFDRIRDNASSYKTESYQKAANRSILETINPTLATRLCAAFVMVALLLLGGATFKPFVAAALVGAIGETYAALFVAAPLLVAWEKSVRP